MCPARHSTSRRIFGRVLTGHGRQTGTGIEQALKAAPKGGRSPGNIRAGGWRKRTAAFTAAFATSGRLHRRGRRHRGISRAIQGSTAQDARTAYAGYQAGRQARLTWATAWELTWVLVHPIKIKRSAVSVWIKRSAVSVWFCATPFAATDAGRQ